MADKKEKYNSETRVINPDLRLQLPFDSSVNDRNLRNLQLSSVADACQRAETSSKQSRWTFHLITSCLQNSEWPNLCLKPSLRSEVWYQRSSLTGIPQGQPPVVLMPYKHRGSHSPGIWAAPLKRKG